MKKIVSLLIVFLSVLIVNAQETYFPLDPGSYLLYENYNAKGKIESFSKQTVVSKKDIPGGFELEIKAESFDNKNKPTNSGELKMKMVNDVFYIDLSKMFATGEMKDMEMSIEGGNMELPNRLLPGQVLKDGHISIQMMANGTAIMSMVADIKERKVEALESVTTPAGIFDAAKVSQKVSMKTMFTIETRSNEWYVKGLGMVKSESLDKNGKLLGYTQLKEYKK